ncbi:heme-binding beta-barrel domain-containing protein [Pseudomonadota bacterium]
MSNVTVVDGVDYGPLAALIGSWEGNKGLDVAPEPDGKDETPYSESILYEAIGDVTNAGEQTLAVLRYHQIVRLKSSGEVFHNETGYWSWDSKSGVLMHSLTIPRGVALLAGGDGKVASDGSVDINVEAAIDSNEWGIVQSPFMQEKARTVGFKQHVAVNGSNMEYSETTLLEIYGKSFEHTDGNVLTKVS